MAFDDKNKISTVVDKLPHGLKMYSCIIESFYYSTLKPWSKIKFIIIYHEFTICINIIK